MNKENLIKELTFKTAKSSGAGGQHVNKVSSKVILMFNITDSLVLSEEEKELLLQNLSTKITKESVLILSSDKSRSQHKNKEAVIKRFLDLIFSSLVKPIDRKQTKPSKASVLKNEEQKRKQAFKKAFRKKPRLE
ncbi:alternative ribosome rescue aminoacyl-tRNA hydrolase ArfB [Tenacibaculum sp. UWU-22]|uniref:alternative ribosome rescue aminoacyl-tRNA hydrolase ArfB n=1 Tax=Tenacibaculum sp. UWU-22 TaxID=3234187 RepID=UPI0034DB1FA5